MTLDEYELTGKALYEEFTKVVKRILETAINANGNIRLQVIQIRAKESSEVRKKLNGAETDIESKVKDLAGARIIVYTDSDVTRLDNSGILLEKFDIVRERTKFHYPHQTDKADQSQFIGRNYVVRLKDSCVALPELRRFIGLQCEVQVQTILNHAWSETAHDTIYKSPKLNGVGAAQMAKIKERMHDIQQKYLLRAGYEFQQVLNDFQIIVSGQRLIDCNILTSIRDAADNNVRVELLEQFRTAVLPIIDDAAAAAPEIRTLLIEAARKAEAMVIAPFESPMGMMSGRTHEEVLDKILSILADIQYIDPAEAYVTYVDLYFVFDVPELKQKVVTAIGGLAKHNLHIWKRYGPAVQETLLDAIAETPPSQLGNTRPLMIEVADNCLQSDIAGITSTSRTFTWEIGSVTLSDQMCLVRDRAIDILKDLFTSSQNEEERRKIYSAMQSAARLPTQGRYSDPLLGRVLTDTCAIISFLTEQADNLDAQLKQKIEHDTLFHYQRARVMPADMLKNTGLRAARDSVIFAALALREIFNSDGDYVIFKTLVGFESVFDYEWDEDVGNIDFSVKGAFRKERAADFLAQVTDETADAWFDRLNGYAAIQSDDLATFPLLRAFISDIARKCPEISASWMDRSHDQPLLQFRPDILLGLYTSDRGTALKWVYAALDRRDDLWVIAHFIRQAVPAAPDILEKVANTAIGANDDVAVYNVLGVCAARPSDYGMPLARRLAMEALSYLSSRSRYRWTEPLWVWGKNSGLLAQLDDANRAMLFEAIRDLPDIDFRAEEILAIYGESYADEIIDMFGARLERERAEKQDALIDDRFEAIPHDFSRLHHSMQSSGAILLPKALDWHRADPYLGQYKSARLVANIFPVLPEDVIKKLVVYAGSGDRAAQEFVIDVMSNYAGAEVAFIVLKELVAVLPAEDELLRGVRAALGETGVMHGEFGYRNAIIAEQDRLQSWLADEREQVRLFAKALIQSLENAIAAAQQNAESDIAMRKLEFGEGLNDDTSKTNSNQVTT